MQLSKLTRRHAILLALAALFALGGILTAVFRHEPPLDRAALGRLAAEAATEPATTGTVD
jgi:hypothetical protein